MNRYHGAIQEVFSVNHKKGSKRVAFGRQEFDIVCDRLKIDRIKNLGDIVYSFRYRDELPEAITKTAPTNCEWIILGTGKGLYEFRLAKKGKLEPASGRLQIKIPDATPEVFKMYAAGSDEQALLTRVRYNRILDLFTGLTCYSVQNHLRTSVAGLGQIEVDEVYVGVGKNGAHFVLPCQAKSPGDQFGVVQVYQDYKYCTQQFPNAGCRPIAAQFTGDDSFAILELALSEEDEILQLVVVEERHYKLVPKDQITPADLASYKQTI